MASQAVATEGQLTDTIFGELQKNWGWLLFLGILFLVLGITLFGGCSTNYGSQSKLLKKPCHKNS